MKVLILLCFQVLFVTSQVSEEDIRRSQETYSQLMKHDGKKRVQTITEKNIEKFLNKYKILVIMYWVDDKSEKEKIKPKEMELLEVVAQVFQGKSVGVGTMEIKSNQEFAMAIGVKYTGMITVFNRKRITAYSGQRSPDVMVPYLSKMLLGAPVTVISAKADKKSFEQNELSKVIAYLEKDSKESQIYSDAALTFQPIIPFYAVYDAKLAKQFHLKKFNTIHLVKPFEKVAVFSGKKEFNERAIVKFIRENKRQRLTKLRVENIHDVWAVDKNGYVIPIFANVKTEEGAKFFSLAKSLAKQYEKHTNLTFVWIDPTPFPMMIEYWRNSFEINPLRPTLGAVDIHKQLSAWYNPINEEEEVVFNMDAIKKWMKDLLNEKISLNPFKPATSEKPENATDETGIETDEMGNESEQSREKVEL